MDNPKLSTAWVLTILTVLVLAGVVKVYPRVAGDILLVCVLVLLALAVTGSMLAYWVFWIIYQATNRLEDYYRAKSETPLHSIARTLQHLTPDQLDLLKANNYYYTMAILPTEDGPKYYLPTPLGPIPREVLERELRLSSMTHLGAIRDYSDKSKKRAERKRFTDWCVLAGWCYPYSGGNEAAQWVSADSRTILAGRLGILLYDDGNEEQNE